MPETVPRLVIRAKRSDSVRHLPLPMSTSRAPSIHRALRASAKPSTAMVLLQGAIAETAPPRPHPTPSSPLPAVLEYDKESDGVMPARPGGTSTGKT